VSEGVSPDGGRHHFLAAMSSIDSANNFFNLAFSSDFHL
jgi:hypothetical protein